MKFYKSTKRLPSGFIHLLFSLSLLLLSFENFSQSIDSIALAYRNAKNDTTKCDLLSEWGSLLFQDYPDSARKIWSTGLKLAEKNYAGSVSGPLKKKFALQVANGLSNIAASYSQKGEWELAVEYDKKSLRIREEYADLEGIANCLNNLGFVYTRQGDLASAMDAYFKCLKISEESKDSLGIGHSLLNIGSGFYRQGDYEEALKFLQRALKIREQIKDKKGVATALNNIAVVYDAKLDYENSLKMYLRVLDIYESMNRKRGIAETYNNIGNVYNQKKEHREAMKFYEMSYAIHKEINNELGIARVLVDMSKANSILGNDKVALLQAENGLELSKKNKLLEYIMDAADQLRLLYRKKGDFAKALDMNDLFIQIKDSLSSEKAKKASIRTQFQFEFDKKEALMKEEKEKQQMLAELKETQQRTVVWVFIIGLLIVAGFSVYIYYRLQVTRQQKQIINKKNAENELLLSEIHHRVKNNLQVISSLLSLQERSTENEGAKSAILEGKERVKSMELVHKMLYQNSKFSGIEMHDYVNKLTLGLIESYGLSKDEVELNTKFEPLTLDVDTAVPLGLIMNELIVNSLKYAKNSTQKLNLKIELQINKDKALQLILADNGKGKVADIEKSNSFGLKIVKALIRQLNGIMEINEAHGLNYTIAFKNFKLIN